MNLAHSKIQKDCVYGKVNERTLFIRCQTFLRVETEPNRAWDEITLSHNVMNVAQQN